MSPARPSDNFCPDVKILPWSRRGSFLSLARTTQLIPGLGLAPQNDVYLVSQCVALALPMFALRPLPDGLTLGAPSGFHKTPSPTTMSATVSSIQWKHKDKVVCEVTFQDVRSIRLRGNVPLAFDSDIRSDPSHYMGIYISPRPASEGFKAGVDVVYKTFPGYRFLLMKGELSTVNGTTNEWKLNRRVQVQGIDEDPSWELVFHELDVRPKQPAYSEDSSGSVLRDATTTSFEAAMNSMANEFDQFALSLCPWAGEELNPAETLASYVTWTSMVRAEARFTREAVMMSKLWMNKVWSWDNCFNALGLIPFSQDTAIDQFHVLYDHQAPNGRLPDSVDWQNVEWGFTKPPIQGWALSKLIANSPNISEKALLELYTCTAKLNEFWMETRRGGQSFLPYYAHGNDSGWDNATAFDVTPVIVSPDCAAYLILQTECLAQVANRLGLESREFKKWTTMKDSLTEALVSELWDGESFHIKNAVTGETAQSTSLIRLIPLVAARHLPSDIVDKMSVDLSKHLSDWGLATEELESPHHERDGYWRGPIWAPPTYLIESGLREAGRIELANMISERFIALCEKSGFAENFDAVMGDGLRDLSYTWTSAVYLILRREAVERKSQRNVLGSCYERS